MDTTNASISGQDTTAACESQQSSTHITDEALTKNLNNISETTEEPSIKSRICPITHEASMASVDDFKIINNNHHHHNHNHDQSQSKSTIKLKRCKHGRIVIKDLSKKKLISAATDREETVSNEFQEEDDNSSSKPLQQMPASVEIDPLKKSAESATSKDMNYKSPLTNSPTLANSSIKKISPSSQLQPTKHIDDQPKKAPNDNDRLQSETTGSTRRGKPIRSSSRSLSPGRSIDRRPSRSWSRSPIRRIKNKARSPYRSSRTRSSSRSRTSSLRRHRSPSPRRRSPSPRRRRSSSFHRRRSPSPRRRNSPSPRRRRSPSPRRRDRSPLPRKRRKRRSRRGGRRSSSRRQGSSYRDRYPSPRSGGGKRNSRARTRSPSSEDSDLALKIRRRGSKSPLRDHYSGDKRYSRESIFDRARKKETFCENQPRTPLEDFRDERKIRTETIDSGVVDNYNSSVQPTQVELRSNQKLDNAKTQITRVAQSTIVEATKSSNSKSSPKNTTNASPRDPPSARSPLTPSNDSVSSDIYDPEGPIIPISPGDSPPLSPFDDIAYAKPIFRPNNDKNGEDDVPSSAVQLNQQEKYLQKLNRQERVIEEVKIALRPYYQNRSIDKNQYKEVLRRAVPKICHSKKGEINPIKIRGLVEAYVRKMKQHHRS